MRIAHSKYRVVPVITYPAARRMTLKLAVACWAKLFRIVSVSSGYLRCRWKLRKLSARRRVMNDINYPHDLISVWIFRYVLDHVGGRLLIPSFSHLVAWHPYCIKV